MQNKHIFVRYNFHLIIVCDLEPSPPRKTTSHRMWRICLLLIWSNYNSIEKWEKRVRMKQIWARGIPYVAKYLNLALGTSRSNTTKAKKNALISDSVTCPPKQYVAINCLRYSFDFIFRFVFKIKTQFCVVSKRGPVTRGVPPQPAIIESTAMLAQLRRGPARPPPGEQNWWMENFPQSSTLIVMQSDHGPGCFSVSDD